MKTDFEPNFYRRLGLAHNATKAEIASAYRKPANEQNIRAPARRSWHETGILTPVFKWPEYADNDMARYYVSLAHLEKGTATTNDLDFLGRYTGKSLGAQPGNKDRQRQFRRAPPQSLFDYNGPAF